jgi:SAM-dependent methyltransferase
MSISSEPNSCCICGGRSPAAFYGKREGHDHWRCRSCNLVYVSPIPAEVLGDGDFIEAAEGEKVEFWSLPRYFARHERIFQSFFEERLARIHGFVPEPGEWLDIGCGYGFWLRFLKERGIAASGLDSSPEAARFTREHSGLVAEEVRFEDFESDRRYSVISACDVFEHFVRPDLMLEKCHRILEPGGLLYIQVPNVLGMRLPSGHGLGLPYHLWQFNPKSLAGLLSRNGFRPLQYWTGVQGVIGAYESGGPSLAVRAKWQLARALKIGNRLQVIARRVDA